MKKHSLNSGILIFSEVIVWSSETLMIQHEWTYGYQGRKVSPHTTFEHGSVVYVSISSEINCKELCCITGQGKKYTATQKASSSSVSGKGTMRVCQIASVGVWVLVVMAANSVTVLCISPRSLRERISLSITQFDWSINQK